MRYQTKIYGHRGASQYAPENSMEAFQLAYDMGADGIEFDVQMTRDGYLVVTHDEEISRVSDGIGYVKDYSLEELRGVQFNKTHPEYEGVQIPLLEEVLEQFVHKRSKADNEFLFNIELKNNIFPYEGMEEKVLKIVKEKKVLGRTLFSSFSHASMLKLREIEETAKVAFLYCDGIIDIGNYAEKYKINTVHPAWYLLNRKDTIEVLHERGIEINIWTVNSGKEIRRFCDMGVNGIITNKPELGSEIRDDK
ncbi:glycerophosphodiester phosphodiesterase [Lacrimispora celerecrescens]|uniref:Glycerophosphoryl diester phosphodiesterase n=1 Tax=[Clostridium] celerecrescens 18A TaxID=1286362 RepID=A0A2M8ZCF5_9FIRM|nr:glycerophosphodiester phosphodiesterase [Lacrimispora celerecrescens]PJJ31129.1 glycerophosphoryl diester phosphodiesterase [[Clostridium] celerecrescens 18A]